MCLTKGIDNEDIITLRRNGLPRFGIEKIHGDNPFGFDWSHTLEGIDMSNYIKVATEDIVCFKVYTYYPELGVFQSPILHSAYSKIERGLEITSDLPIFPNYACIGYTSGRFEFTHGIHSYQSRWEAHLRKRDFLFKCVIPKGTRYAIGIDNDLVADKIRIVRRCIFRPIW